MFGSNRTQQSSDDRPVLIDGKTGKVLDDTRDDDRRDTGRGQERGSAQWIHDEYGRPVQYTPGSEW
jgi:hypothetical protein